MFGRKRGLGDSGTKAGTELDGVVVAWVGNQAYKSGGGVCTSLAVPLQPGPLRAVPVLCNSVMNTACAVGLPGWPGWPLGSKKTLIWE